MSDRDSVTPPRGSGSIRLAEIARELSGRARRVAFLREKNPLKMIEAAELHGIADRLLEMADGFEAWSEVSPDIVNRVRPIMVDEMTRHKDRLEQLGVTANEVD